MTTRHEHEVYMAYEEKERRRREMERQKYQEEQRKDFNQKMKEHKGM